MTIILIKIVPRLILVFWDILINTPTASLDSTAGNSPQDKLDGDDHHDNNFTAFV